MQNWWKELFGAAKGSAVHRVKDEELMKAAGMFKHALEKYPSSAEDLRGFRQSQLAVPGDILERTPVTTAFEDMGPLAWYHHASDDIPSHINYNLKADVGNHRAMQHIAPHENIHAMQFGDLKTLPDRYKEAIPDIDRVRNYSETIAKLVKDPELSKKFKLRNSEYVYEKDPVEVMPGLASYEIPFNQPERYPEYRKDFHNVVRRAAKESAGEFEQQFKGIHDIAKKNFGRYLAVPGAIVGGKALLSSRDAYGGDVNSSNELIELGKVNPTTVGGNNQEDSSFRPALTGLDKKAKNFLEVSSLPVKGIYDMVKGSLGELKEGVKSGVKMVTGSKDASGQDIENALRAGMYALTPAKKITGTSLGVLNDLIFPQETSTLADRP